MDGRGCESVCEGGTRCIGDTRKNERGGGEGGERGLYLRELITLDCWREGLDAVRTKVATVAVAAAIVAMGCLRELRMFLRYWVGVRMHHRYWPLLVHAYQMLRCR